LEIDNVVAQLVVFGLKRLVQLAQLLKLLDLVLQLLDVLFLALAECALVVLATTIGMRALHIPGQRGSGQHASRSTALSVPWSDPRSCSHRRGRQRSCRRRSPQWLGRWRVVGQQCGGAVDAESVEGAGAEAGRWAVQRRQRADVLLSLDDDTC
jgi:hypothetical protein